MVLHSRIGGHRGPVLSLLSALAPRQRWGQWSRDPSHPRELCHPPSGSSRLRLQDSLPPGSLVLARCWVRCCWGAVTWPRPVAAKAWWGSPWGTGWGQGGSAPGASSAGGPEEERGRLGQGPHYLLNSASALSTFHCGEGETLGRAC